MGGSRLAGVRAAVGRRSRKEKAAGLAALALVASAPFGGLDRAPEEPPAALRAGQEIAIGPYDVTFVRAYRVKEYLGTEVQSWNAMSVKPSSESRRLLVIEADVTNGGKRPEYAHVLTKAVGVRGAEKTDAYGGPTTQPRLIYRADGSDVSTMNPGLTHRTALLVEEAATSRTRQAQVTIAEMMYVGKGGLASNLDEDYWLHLDGTARRGTIRVDRAPEARR